MNGQIKIACRRQGRSLVGFIRAIGPKGSYVLRVAFDYRPVIKAVVAEAYRRAANVGAELGASSDRLYEIGFFSKLFRWIKKTVRKIAKSGFIRAIVKGVKWLVTNPLVAGVVGIASHIPLIGPLIKAGHKSITGVAKVVDKAVSGNPMAKKVVAAVAQKAKEGNPTALNIARRMEAHVKTLDPAKVQSALIPVSS